MTFIGDFRVPFGSERIGLCAIHEISTLITKCKNTRKGLFQVSLCFANRGESIGYESKRQYIAYRTFYGIALRHAICQLTLDSQADIFPDIALIICPGQLTTVAVKPLVF